jgi:hypothetical protein
MGFWVWHYSEQTSYRYADSEDEARIHAGFGSELDFTSEGGYRYDGSRDKARIQAELDNESDDESDTHFRYADSEDEARIPAELELGSEEEMQVEAEDGTYDSLNDLKVQPDPEQNIENE